LGEGIAGRWEVAEDGYEEQILIPKEKREPAASEGILKQLIIMAMSGFPKSQNDLNSIR